jgi:hypothetical protein
MYFLQTSKNALQDRFQPAGKHCEIVVLLYITPGAQSHCPSFIGRHQGHSLDRPGNGPWILGRYGNARGGFGDRIIV